MSVYTYVRLKLRNYASSMGVSYVCEDVCAIACLLFVYKNVCFIVAYKDCVKNLFNLLNHRAYI